MLLHGNRYRKEESGVRETMFKLDQPLRRLNCGLGIDILKISIAVSGPRYAATGYWYGTFNADDADPRRGYVTLCTPYININTSHLKQFDNHQDLISRYSEQENTLSYLIYTSWPA